MPDVLHTELTLPADPRMLPLAQDHVRGLTDLAELPADQAEALLLAVRQACSNVIEFAYDEEDSGTFTLTGELTPAALTLAVLDRGLPFDQDLEADYLQAPPESPSQAKAGDLGLYLIHQGADEVRWINHGPDGKELRLTKYRSGLCRLEPPPVAPNPSPQTTAPAVSREYAIRLLCPEDADRLAQLMYRVYGYSYSWKDFYYPDRLAHDLETGTHVGVVAVADNSEIVGHAGIMRPDLGPLAELGQLAVAPWHRGQGLVKRMGDRLQAEIQRLGLVGLYAEAVTVHTISQEGSENRGLHVTGIKLLDWQAYFKKPQTFESGSEHLEAQSNSGSRETMVFYFKYLRPPGPQRLCAPSRHQGMLARIYGNLDIPVEFLEPSGPTGPGRLAVHFDPATGVGSIQVNRIGLDSLPEIQQARRDLCDIGGAAVVGLDLPLAQGGTPYLCAAAEAEGFFFSGVRPHFAADGDFLRLQYLNAPLDPDRVHLSSPFARDLLTYILKEKARVGQNPGR